MAFSQIIARLGVQLGLDTASFETGSRKAQREVTTLQGKMKLAGAAMTGALAGLGAGIVLGGLQSAVSGAFELASSMSEAATRVGLTVEALQELRLAGQETGVSNEALESSLARLNVQLGDLQAGSETAVKAFDAIGLSAKDLKGLSPDEALGVIADKLMAIEDPTLRAAAAQNIFGKSYAQLLPLIEGGSAALDEYAKKSREQGQISTEDAKKLDDLADSWENAKTRIGVATANLIAGTADFVDRVQGWIDAEKRWEDSVVAGAKHMATEAINWISQMVTGISNAIGGTLRAVWDGAIAKLGALGEKFRWLYDVVVGHSYIPDMVDGIAAEMARLDAVMVTPAGKATAATAKKFQELRDLLARLFPEVGTHTRFTGDIARLGLPMSGALDPQKAEQWVRLQRELAGVDLARGPGKTGPSFDDAVTLTDGMRDVGAAIERLTEKAKIGSVKIADSFKDMADKTLQSLGTLASAIKGGGFLNILEAVIGIGLQLGSMGVFGKTISGRLNSVPGYAGGTNFHPGGLAMVGERGPELVSMPRGSRVMPHGAMSGGNVYHISGNLLTEEFWARINAGDLGAAQSGARGAIAMSNYRGSRRVG